VASAIHYRLPEEKRTNPAEIRKKIEEMCPKAQKDAEKFAVIGALYVYKMLTDEEFQRYVAFAESMSGKHYHTVTHNAVRNAMQMASQEFGKSLAEKTKRFPVAEEVTISGKIVVHLKDGRTLLWDNCTEKNDRYCTFIAGGELCINKKDVASIGRK
jgi:hypothetical protein